MIKFTLQSIEDAARNKPAGYYEEVLAAGVVEGNTITLTRKAYNELHKKFTNPSFKEPELPSTLEMAANFASALAKDMGSGMKRRTEEEAHAILDQHCKPCEFYRDSDKRCSKCGCFLAVKTAWKSQHCPIGKW